MSLADILLAEQKIHIVDDFYSNLDWLDEHLKTAQFFSPEEVNYAGLTSWPPAISDLGKERINEILGTTMKFDKYDGQIRVVFEKDKGTEKTFVHVDHLRLTVLVYLSDPPPHLTAENTGTHFYQHKQFKNARFRELGSVKNEFQNAICIRDSKDLDKWDRWTSIPLKKNRAIFFDGHLFHSPPERFFGDSLMTGRATQHFFPSRLI